MTEKVYAKLNLILNIKGKREDGFHEIESFFQAIDLWDLISVEASEKDSVEFLSSGDYSPELPVSDNIAYKALCLMKDTFNREENYSVKIEKHIPPAAGLGGGSADAAGVISILSKIWGLSESQMLYDIAAKLGSDVPFCLGVCFGHSAAIGRGRGEILEFVSPIDARVDLFTKNISLANKTASVYKALIPEDYLVQYDVDAFMKANNINEKKSLMGNHLQPALESLTGLHEDMLLCGAGPTYFVFSDKGEYRTIL